MDIRAQVVLQDTSGFAEDRYINTFYFRTPDPTLQPGEGSNIAQALTQFYLTPQPITGQALAGFLAPHIVEDPNPQVRLYDANEGGSPVEIHELLGWETPSSQALPPQTALVLSFHADLTGVPEEIPEPPDGPAGDVRPASRMRGRVFIGPFNVDALPTPATTAVSRPRIDLTNTLRLNGQRLKYSVDLAEDGTVWMVHSETTGLMNPVQGGWVDDRWDTLRKRSPRPTTRLSFA